MPSRAIGEAIGDKARRTRDTSFYRSALAGSRQAIAATHVDEQLRLQAITLDPAIEHGVSTRIPETTVIRA
ncbi:MAG: hypothetical protein ACYDC2_05540 [Solirubrobacteraceae bacterium]